MIYVLALLASGIAVGVAVVLFLQWFIDSHFPPGD